MIVLHYIAIFWFDSDLFWTGIYFDVPEITPNAVGIFRFNNNSDMVNVYILYLYVYVSGMYHTFEYYLPQTKIFYCDGQISGIWHVTASAVKVSVPAVVTDILSFVKWYVYRNAAGLIPLLLLTLEDASALLYRKSRWIFITYVLIN